MQSREYGTGEPWKHPDSIWSEYDHCDICGELVDVESEGGSWNKCDGNVQHGAWKPCGKYEYHCDNCTNIAWEVVKPFTCISCGTYIDGDYCEGCMEYQTPDYCAKCDPEEFQGKVAELLGVG